MAFWSNATPVLARTTGPTTARYAPAAAWSARNISVNRVSFDPAAGTTADTGITPPGPVTLTPAASVAASIGAVNVSVTRSNWPARDPPNAALVTRGPTPVTGGTTGTAGGAAGGGTAGGTAAGASSSFARFSRPPVCTRPTSPGSTSTDAFSLATTWAYDSPKPQNPGLVWKYFVILIAMIALGIIIHLL